MPKQTYEKAKIHNTRNIIVGTLIGGVLLGGGYRGRQLEHADLLGKAQAAADSRSKLADSQPNLPETHISTAAQAEYHLVSKKLGAHGRIWDVATKLEKPTGQDVRTLSDLLETYYPNGDVQPNQTLSFYEDENGKVIANPNPPENSAS